MAREHVIFIALSGDRAPHFTTIAGFVSALGEDITPIFTQVLFICDCQGLIGRELFAIDGVKLPSNASKARGGTRADFERQAGKLEASVQTMLARHRAEDEREVEPDLAAKQQQRIERLQHDAARIPEWLVDHPAARHGMRSRDERFATQARHQETPAPRYDKSTTEKQATTYQPSDFTDDPKARACVCPAGKSRYGNGSHCLTHGFVSVRFRGAERDCVPGAHRVRCLRTPAKIETRQVACFQGKAAATPESHTDRMKQQRIDAQWKLFGLVHNIRKLAHHGYAS